MHDCDRSFVVAIVYIIYTVLYIPFLLSATIPEENDSVSSAYFVQPTYIRHIVVMLIKIIDSTISIIITRYSSVTMHHKLLIPCIW